MFAEIAKPADRLDVLVNNAASGVLSTAIDLTRQALGLGDGDQRAAVPALRAGGRQADGRGGRVIALSSLGSQRVIPGYAAVGVSKAAAEAITRYLAVELAPRGITVNTVARARSRPTSGARSRTASGCSRPRAPHAGGALVTAEAVADIVLLPRQRRGAADPGTDHRGGRRLLAAGMTRARRIVVTGLDVVTPIGVRLEAFWKAALAGTSGVRRITHFDPHGLADADRGGAHRPGAGRRSCARERARRAGAARCGDRPSRRPRRGGAGGAPGHAGRRAPACSWARAASASTCARWARWRTRAAAPTARSRRASVRAGVRAPRAADRLDAHAARST